MSERGRRQPRPWQNVETKALALALRVVEDPGELHLAVAELLDAEPVAAPIGDSTSPAAPNTTGL